MFVPSESVYAELGERLPDILQRAYRARVVIVSPSLLMLSIQLVQNLLKDARMRQEAGRIQTEVRHLAEELARLDERVGALKTHFTRTGRDVDEILTATRKVMQRADRIETLPFQDEGAPKVPLTLRKNGRIPACSAAVHPARSSLKLLKG